MLLLALTVAACSLSYSTYALSLSLSPPMPCLHACFASLARSLPCSLALGISDQRHPGGGTEWAEGLALVRAFLSLSLTFFFLWRRDNVVHEKAKQASVCSASLTIGISGGMVKGGLGCPIRRSWTGGVSGPVASIERARR